MIHVDTEGPLGEQYSQWRKKAEQERTKILEEWQNTGQVSELNQKIWKELKEIFLNYIFHQKCAYCEGKISAHVTLDVEHYRPKKQITERRILLNHCGYFWLAYEWYNLLLACRHCNSFHKNTINGKLQTHPGKANEFCVNGNRINNPSLDPENWQNELSQEQPLLLNPYFDYPEDHIAFDENGFAYPKGGSDRGKETIDVCDLNRPALVEARLEVKYKVSTRMINFINELINNCPSQNCRFDDSETFSAWLNNYMEFIADKLKSNLSVSVQRTSS